MNNIRLNFSKSKHLLGWFAVAFHAGRASFSLGLGLHFAAFNRKEILENWNESQLFLRLQGKCSLWIRSH